MANLTIAFEGRALELRHLPKNLCNKPVHAYKFILGVARALAGVIIVVAIRRVKGAVTTEPPSHTQSQRHECNTTKKAVN